MSEFNLTVDPGKGGGLAWIDSRGNPRACRMPKTDEETLCAILAVVREWTATAPGNFCHAYHIKPTATIELVGGYVAPREVEEDEEETKGQPGSAMFRFGENAGLVRGMLLALGFIVELTPPRSWQQIIIERRGKRMGKPQWKRILKAAAQRRFPDLKVTLNTADALLMLAYKRPEIVRGGLTAPAKAPGHAGGALARKAGPSGAIPRPCPEGYKRVTEGGTCAADLVWNKDKKTWEPVDAVNEHVSEYIAVCRPVAGNTEPHEGFSFYVGPFKGKPWVFKVTASKRSFLVREADAKDMETLSPLPEKL